MKDIKKVLNLLLVAILIFTAFWQASFVQAGEEYYLNYEDVVIGVYGEMDAEIDLPVPEIIEEENEIPMPEIIEEENEIDLPIDDDSLSTPMITSTNFNVYDWNICDNAEEAIIHYPFPEDHYYVTNLISASFEHHRYFNPHPLPPHRYVYRHSYIVNNTLGVAVPDIYGNPTRDGGFIDFFNGGQQEEGIYEVIIRGHFAPQGGLPSADVSGFIYVNIQQTESVVDIDGNRNSTLDNPVYTPDVVRIGRMETPNPHGYLYEYTWEIVNVNTGEIMRSEFRDGRNGLINNELTAVDVSDFPHGVYEVRNTVVEITPPAFPNADIQHSTNGAFFIPELSIEKEVDQAVASVGDTLLYTITVTNHSEFNVFGYQVIDDLSELIDAEIISFDPASVSVDSRNGYTATFEDNRLRVVFSELYSMEVAMITFEVVVLDAALGETFVNVAVLEDADDNKVDDDDVTAVVPDPSIPELSIKKEVDQNVASVGDTLLYTITVTNHSEFNVFGYQVIDDLSELIDAEIISFDPASVSVDSRNGYTATFEDNRLRVVFSELYSMEVAMITFEVVVLDAALGETFVNVAVLEDADDNKVDDDDVTVVVPDPSIPELSIKKEVDQNVASVGDTLLYTITVTNHSEFNVFGYQVIDDLNELIDAEIISFDPASVSVDSRNGYTATFEDNRLRVVFSELYSMEVAMITFEVVVLDAALGETFVNVAVLEDPGNNKVDNDDATVVVPHRNPNRNPNPNPNPNPGSGNNNNSARLPNTGANVQSLALSGVALVNIGVIVAILKNRRR